MVPLGRPATFAPGQFAMLYLEASKTAGHAVLLSGLTGAVGLLSLLRCPCRSYAASAWPRPTGRLASYVRAFQLLSSETSSPVSVLEFAGADVSHFSLSRSRRFRSGCAAGHLALAHPAVSALAADPSRVAVRRILARTQL